jgi:ATP-dependent 26S proteasome regulatory subunit
MSSIHNPPPHIVALQEALVFSPDNVPLKKHLASLLMKEQMWEEALNHWRDVNKAETTSESLLALGECQFQLKQFEKAGTRFQEVLALQPNAQAFFWLSKVNDELNQPQQALAFYHKALAMDALLEDSHYQRLLEEKANQFEKPGSGSPTKGHTASMSGFQELGDETDYVEAHTEEHPEREQITFAQVGGMEDLKDAIRMQIITPFLKPELFKQFGKKVQGGILLYGPPGCGKTFMARATAGECQAHFFNIAIHDILDMYIGESEKNLHSLFEQARRKAPSVIFIDELDALGGKRSDGTSRSLMSLTNQLLNEMDGFASNNENILIMGATNSPWLVDSALKRPGRFGRTLFVPPPDATGRAEILKLHLADKPIDAIDTMKLAKQLDRFSGADIMALVELATEQAILETMKKGTTQPITQKHLEQAAKKLNATTLEWLASAKNYALYSNQGGTYDELNEYFKANKQ